MPLFFITQLSSRNLHHAKNSREEREISFNSQLLLLAPPLAPRRDGEFHTAKKKKKRKETEKKEICSRICIIVRVQLFTELEVNGGGYFPSPEAAR